MSAAQTLTLPTAGAPFVLRGVRLPRCFRHDDDPREMVATDIGVAHERIAFVTPSDVATPTDWAELALPRSMVMPCYAEPHVHLDSTQIWDRSPNPDGSFDSAAEAIINDRFVHWSAEEMERRMEFGLRCAYAYGVRAMRTHLASQNEQIEERWEVFADLRDRWAGRIALQAVPLISTEALAEPGWLERVTEVVVRHGGVMGAFAPMSDDVDAQVARLFAVAEKHGLALDFHADETLDPRSAVLPVIARAAIAYGIGPSVLAGHCCSMAAQDERQVDQTLELVERAGLSIVSLPSTNLYLQDRAVARTPRLRGVTLLRELDARGIPVCIGNDNCRDSFHPYGDFNPLEALRDGIRIAHLEHELGNWPHAVTTTPARIIDRVQQIAPGEPADLVIYRAGGFMELLARPWLPQLLVRGGRVELPDLPDFAELEA